MYVDIKIETLREMLREELSLLLKEMSQGEKPVRKPMSITELANHFKVSKATIHNWINAKIITGFKMGKGRFFYLDEVEKGLRKFNYLDALQKKVV